MKKKKKGGKPTSDPVQTFRAKHELLEWLKTKIGTEEKSEAILEAINHRLSCPIDDLDPIDFSEYATIEEIAFQTGKDFSTVFRWSDEKDVEIQYIDKKQRLIHIPSLEKFLGYSLGTIQTNQVSADEIFSTFEVIEYLNEGTTLNVDHRKVRYYRERGDLTPIKPGQRPLQFLITEVENLKLELTKPTVHTMDLLDEEHTGQEC